MTAALGSLLLLACLSPGATPAEPAGSYLTTYRRGADGVLRTEVEAYVPQPGDVVLYDDHSKAWKILYTLAGSDVPDHSGIVFRLPDGRPALVESGPDNGMYVCILDVLPRFQNFEGTIYIRRLRNPLGSEPSARLTAFALAQEGKHYATGRLLLQMTPFRCRGPWRREMFGHTDLNRRRWLCSELVVAAGTVAGLFDPKVHFANAIYPRDIIFDDTYDLSPTWHVAGVWSAAPPARTIPK